jgi:uncharacterized membrane protein (DUF4010 family)
MPLNINLFPSHKLNYNDHSIKTFAQHYISGIADVDAITISMALLAGDNIITPDVAVTAITLAAISNTIIKFLIAMFLGTRKFGYMIGMIFAFIIFAGLLAIFFV